MRRRADYLIAVVLASAAVDFGSCHEPEGVPLKRIVFASLLGAAAVGALIFALVKGRSQAPERAGANAGDAGVTIYAVNAWLDSCLGGCRATAQRRLGHLPAEKRRQYCDVNCECGMEKMTEPGPQAGQVKAPSAAWLRLTEDQRMQAARDCQQRSNVSVGGPQPPGAP